MKWHKYPDEKPTGKKKYLVCEDCFRQCKSYEVADYCTDFYALDKFDFADYKGQKKSGFVRYDTEFGYFENLYVIAWCEIEEYKGGL